MYKEYRFKYYSIYRKKLKYLDVSHHGRLREKEGLGQIIRTSLFLPSKNVACAETCFYTKLYVHQQQQYQWYETLISDTQCADAIVPLCVLVPSQSFQHIRLGFSIPTNLFACGLIQKQLLPNFLMVPAKLHVNIPTKPLKNTHTLLYKIAKALSETGRTSFNGAITNASNFEKQRGWRYRLKFEKLAVLLLPLVISDFSSGTAITSAFFSDRQQRTIRQRRQEQL